MREKNMRTKRHRRNRRGHMMVFFLLSCVVCFLCGFSFRNNNQTMAMADSGFTQEEDWDFAVSELSEIQGYVETKDMTKCYTSIVIETGDTLSGIAAEYMDEHYQSMDDYIRELKEINGLRDNYLRQGDYITVPYYK